jgi:hypothetical protein
LADNAVPNKRLLRKAKWQIPDELMRSVANGLAIRLANRVARLYDKVGSRWIFNNYIAASKILDEGYRRRAQLT